MVDAVRDQRPARSAPQLGRGRSRRCSAAGPRARGGPCSRRSTSLSRRTAADHPLAGLQDLARRRVAGRACDRPSGTARPARLPGTCRLRTASPAGCRRRSRHVDRRSGSGMPLLRGRRSSGRRPCRGRRRRLVAGRPRRSPSATRSPGRRDRGAPRPRAARRARAAVGITIGQVARVPTVTSARAGLATSRAVATSFASRVGTRSERGEI